MYTITKNNLLLNYLFNKFTYLTIIVYVFINGMSLSAQDLHVGDNKSYSTISAAMEACSDGDVIIIHSGVYQEHGLRPKSNTIIRGAKGEVRPVINAMQGNDTRVSTFNISSASNITLKDLDIRGGGGHERGSVTIGSEGRGVSDIILDHCKISETNAGGTHRFYNPAHIRICYQETVRNITIKNCEITGKDASGFKIDSYHGRLTNLIIKNNYIHDVVNGVALKWGDNTSRNIIVENNLIENCSERGIYCDQSHVTIKNNVIALSKTGMRFCDNFGGSNCQIEHNTVYGSSKHGIYFGSCGNNNRLINNIIYRVNRITDYSRAGNNIVRHNFTSNPLFTDVQNHDYTLQPESNARGRASDGKDFGADITLVGIDTSGSGIEILMPPENLRIETME